MGLFKKKFMLTKGSFFTNALILLTGTTFAQILVVVSAPILSRLYSPADFGVMAVFVSISSMIGLIACGRYENAIMLPQDDVDAVNILGLAVLLAFVTSLLVLLIVGLFRQQIAAALKKPELAAWLWFIPVTVLMIGSYHACNFWSSRKKQFHRLAISRVSNAVGLLGSQIGIGVMGKGGPLGLIAGQIAGSTVGAGVLAGQLLRQDFSFMTRNIKKRKMLQQAKIYYRFPLLDIWAILANFGAQKFPILILNNFFDATVVGYYFFGYRVLNLPLLFINASISQVFFQRYEEKRKTAGKKEFLWKTIKYLAGIAILPAVFLLLFSTYIFKFTFGEEWVVAGEYIRVLVPILFFRFIAGPISTVAWSEGKNLWYLIWQITLLSCSVTSFLIGGYFQEIYYALILFSISASILYMISIIMGLKMASYR